jgi:hypothetical protein
MAVTVCSLFTVPPIHAQNEYQNSVASGTDAGACRSGRSSTEASTQGTANAALQTRAVVFKSPPLRMQNARIALALGCDEQLLPRCCASDAVGHGACVCSAGCARSSGTHCLGLPAILRRLIVSGIRCSLFTTRHDRDFKSKTGRYSGRSREIGN